MKSCYWKIRKCRLADALPTTRWAHFNEIADEPLFYLTAGDWTSRRLQRIYEQSRRDMIAKAIEKALKNPVFKRRICEANGWVTNKPIQTSKYKQGVFKDVLKHIDTINLETNVRINLEPITFRDPVSRRWGVVRNLVLDQEKILYLGLGGAIREKLAEQMPFLNRYDLETANIEIINNY